MADASGRGGGKALAADPSTPGGARPRGRRGQGGRVVESRYLQYEKKPARKAPAAADAAKPAGKAPDGGRKPSLLQRSRDGSGPGKGDLQSTLLEGHGAAPPELDLSAIHDKSALRRTPQLEKTLSKKPEATSFSASRKRSPDGRESADELESQALLFALLTVKVEGSLARLEEKAEGELLALARERRALQARAHELRRTLLLSQRTRALEAALDAQAQMLGPLEAVAGPFRERYGTLAGALDATRHELPARSIHLAGDGPRLLDALQLELAATRRLLSELAPGTAEDGARALELLRELKDAAVDKDLELRRSFARVLELSAEASKEAALTSQEAWEAARGAPALSRCYFQREAGGGEPPGAPPGAPLAAGDGLRTP